MVHARVFLRYDRHVHLIRFQRKNFARATTLLVIAAALVAALIGVGSPGEARAADLSQFRAGDIISDALFFDGNAMNDAQIQDFLNAKMRSCKSGYTCLKDYRQSTASRGADVMCSAYQGASNETAAQIIGKVGRACGISPKVLLVTLQKEQALILSAAPSDTQYRIAMGFACPDTAPCNTQYYGFFNQVYSAAHQFKRYANPAGTSKFFTWYSPGTTATVQWREFASCGSGRVYIANQATANLYYYTPYQPNAAALQAGYGRGDDCSSYGNRNFFNYYTDWFGSTHGAAIDTDAIQKRYNALGGASGRLGAAVGGPQWSGAVAFQEYTGGRIYWSRDNGAWAIWGWFGDTYAKLGAGTSALGAPIDNERQTTAGGVYQRFTNGTLRVSPATAVFASYGQLDGDYMRMGGENGVLKFPTANQQSVAGGQSQAFQNGVLYTPDGGASHYVRGWFLGAYQSRGASAGALGMPVTNESSGPANGITQKFAAGGLYLANGAKSVADAHAVRGSIYSYFNGLGGTASWLGYPLADEYNAAGGAIQTFPTGSIYWSHSRGVGSVLSAAELDAYVRNGGADGVLGLATSGTFNATGGGTVKRFEGGSLYYNPATKADYSVWGGIGNLYESIGGTNSALGLPKSDEQRVPSGAMQEFAGGRIYWSYAMVRGFVVTGANLSKYASLGYDSSQLGGPVSAEANAVGGGRYQRFANGSLYFTPSKNAAFAVRGLIGTTYESAGGSGSGLGLPTGDETTAAGWVVQTYEHGRIVCGLGDTGTHRVQGAIADAYAKQGAEAGKLGLPLSDQRSVGGELQQTFEKGTIHWTSQKGSWIS